MAPRKTETIALDGNLSIQRAETLYKDLMDKIESPSNIKLDMTEVTGMDFAGLQLIYSLYRTMQESKRNLEVINVQPSIQEWFEMSDFSSMIEKE